jgi:uncharacterized membrane protein
MPTLFRYLVCVLVGVAIATFFPLAHTQMTAVVGIVLAAIAGGVAYAVFKQRIYLYITVVAFFAQALIAPFSFHS